MRTWTILFSTLLMATACGGQAVTATVQHDAGTPPTTTPAQGQHILFELSYVNFAWGLTINGAYVTDTGDVYRYDYAQSSESDAGVPYLDLVAGMTEEQITQKHGTSPQVVGKVDASTLLAKFALVGGAGRGVLLTQSNCADYGDARYVAYLFDPATSLYTPVMLGSDGDVAVLNTAPEGDQLVEWLRGLAGDTGERACRYQASECFGSLCPGVSPCEAGTVPMMPSDAGCMTYCGSASRCESVPDCATCAAEGSACVLDERGGLHCVRWLPGCSSDMSCDCGGDGLCASGASSCRGTAASGLSCARP